MFKRLRFFPTPHLFLKKGSEKHHKTLIGPKSRTIMIQKPPRQSQQRDNSFDQRGWRALESRIPFFQVITMLTK